MIKLLAPTASVRMGRDWRGYRPFSPPRPCTLTWAEESRGFGISIVRFGWTLQSGQTREYYYTTQDDATTFVILAILNKGVGLPDFPAGQKIYGGEYFNGGYRAQLSEVIAS